MDKDTFADGWIAIYVPHRGEPKAWFGYGFADFARRINERSGRVVFETATARELAKIAGLDLHNDVMAPAVDDLDGFELMLRQAIDAHGADTTLYRADYLHGSEGEYTPEAIDEVDAYLAAAAHDLSAFYVVTNETELAELYARLTGPDGPRIGKCGPIAAAYALQRMGERLGWIERKGEDEE